MNKPHKHAEVIKAWADGADIEVECQDGVWRSVVAAPSWDRDFEYRVKPEPKSYLQIYCETSYPKTTYPNGWGTKMLCDMESGIDAVVKAVCERNNIPYPCK